MLNLSPQNRVRGTDARISYDIVAPRIQISGAVDSVSEPTSEKYETRTVTFPY